MREELGLDLIEEGSEWDDEELDRPAPRWLVIFAIALVVLSITAVVIIGVAAFSQGLFPGQPQPLETEPEVVSIR